MGIVIRFPQERRLARSGESPPFAESATIIILPVVRTERHADTAPVASSASVSSQQRPPRRRAAVRPTV
jgi:hypothetical protein